MDCWKQVDGHPNAMSSTVWARNLDNAALLLVQQLEQVYMGTSTAPGGTAAAAAVS
jgi:hypothetical protein